MKINFVYATTIFYRGLYTARCSVNIVIFVIIIIIIIIITEF